ncbi:unnamed protein product [Symbiodinium sp. CCMP2592]|nr:unnamed protein product [Symbiodinium sp. CCMP2592]
MADSNVKRPRLNEEEEGPIERQMRQVVRFLADDSLKGRQPGTAGEEVAAAFVASKMEELGCAPAGEEGSYFQTVRMVGLTAVRNSSKMAFEVQNFQLTGRFGDDYVQSMDHLADAEPECAFEGLDLVFVGHGVSAPGLGWDDFKDQDMTSKVLLVLISQPPVKPFPQDDMTYYGRWTYKFEEARRRGAAGCLIIHFSDEFAGYPWSVTRTGYSGEKVALEKPQTNPLALHGWLQHDLASKLAVASGTTLDHWVQQARQQDFRPLAVGRISHSALYEKRCFSGRNVLGFLPGEEAHRHEAVVIAGHHDHLGQREGEIYNGAVDNCTGVAMMLATARRLIESGIQLKRSVLLMAPTAEECGLLGSDFYAAEPLMLGQRQAKPIAAFAFDVGNVWGKTRDISVLGLGKSTLDPLLNEVASAQGLTLVPDLQPKMGLFYRSDHWSFVRRGVPGCWFFFGRDFIGKPSGYYEEVVGRYIQSEYHKPADIYHPHWTMSGLLSQVDFTVGVAQALASRTDILPAMQRETASPSLEIPEIPASFAFRRRPGKKGVSFGLRCFDCKIEGCVCFL